MPGRRAGQGRAQRVDVAERSRSAAGRLLGREAGRGLAPGQPGARGPVRRRGAHRAEAGEAGPVGGEQYGGRGDTGVREVLPVRDDERLGEGGAEVRGRCARRGGRRERRGRWGAGEQAGRGGRARGNRRVRRIRWPSDAQGPRRYREASASVV